VVKTVIVNAMVSTMIEECPENFWYKISPHVSGPESLVNGSIEIVVPTAPGAISKSICCISELPKETYEQASIEMVSTNEVRTTGEMVGIVLRKDLIWTLYVDASRGSSV